MIGLEVRNLQVGCAVLGISRLDYHVSTFGHKGLVGSITHLFLSLLFSAINGSKASVRFLLEYSLRIYTSPILVILE